MAASSSVLRASRWAKVHRDSHYEWMRTVPGYPEAFAGAERRGARVLQDEAVRRAHEGIRKAVYYKGKVVGYQTEYSDTLMITMLKATDPEKFRDRTDQRHSNDPDNPLLDIESVRAFLERP